MQQINITELKPHPRNNEFFDDMTGENWEAFLESIKTSGVIEPIVITGDMYIISGHQRVRACKELGIDTIMTECKPYYLSDNYDVVLKNLIETNIRQRGIGNTNQRKMGLCIKELDRIYGIREGSNNKKGDNRLGEGNNFTDKSPKTEEELLKSLGLGIDRRTIQNYKKLTEMIPELEDLVDTGIVMPTTALAIMRNLSEAEQIELISSMDTTKKITKNEVQKYIDEINRLKSENTSLKKDSLDSATISKLQIEKEQLQKENKILESQKKISDDLAAQYKSQSEEYIKIKEKLSRMGTQPDGDYNTFNATVKITELNGTLMDLLQNQLAPLKYQQYMYAIKENNILKTNLLSTLHMLKDWYEAMLFYLGEETNDENIIDIEMEEN